MGDHNVECIHKVGTFCLNNCIIRTSEYKLYSQVWLSQKLKNWLKDYYP